MRNPIPPRTAKDLTFSFVPRAYALIDKMLAITLERLIQLGGTPVFAMRFPIGWNIASYNCRDFFFGAVNPNASFTCSECHYM